ncbi:hypothetical protein BH09BAC4_BH09BAC4_18370 [soil metagenome]
MNQPLYAYLVNKAPAGLLKHLTGLTILCIIHCSAGSYHVRAQTVQLPKKQSASSMLNVAIRLIDAETDTIVSNAKLSVIEESNGQPVPVAPDSLGFRLAGMRGSSYIVQASAPDYFEAKTRIFNLSLSQRLIIKLMRTRPSVLIIKAFAVKIDQPLSPATAVITSRITGKSERFQLQKGRLQRSFTKPDNLDIEVSAPGYNSAHRQLTIDVAPTGKRYEFDAELDKTAVDLTIRAVDSQTNQAVVGGRFILSGPVGMAPIVLAPSPEVGLFGATLPARGAYQLRSNAKGYEDVTFLVVTNKAQNEVLVKLTPIPPTPELAEPKPDISVGELKANRTAKETSTASVSAITTKIFGVIEKGKSIQLNKIYFDQSSPVLRPQSYTELNQLYDVLTQYPTLRIEIRGHTDNQGDLDLNIQLSRDRCQAVIDYLATKGIRRTRLTAVGRGPLDPVAPNNNEENRKKNRRVEFVLL